MLPEVPVARRKATTAKRRRPGHFGARGARWQCQGQAVIFQELEEIVLRYYQSQLVFGQIESHRYICSNSITTSVFANATL